MEALQKWMRPHRTVLRRQALQEGRRSKFCGVWGLAQPEASQNRNQFEHGQEDQETFQQIFGLILSPFCWKIQCFSIGLDNFSQVRHRQGIVCRRCAMLCNLWKWRSLEARKKILEFLKGSKRVLVRHTRVVGDTEWGPSTRKKACFDRQTCAVFWSRFNEQLLGIIESRGRQTRVSGQFGLWYLVATSLGWMSPSSESWSGWNGPVSSGKRQYAEIWKPLKHQASCCMRDEVSKQRKKDGATLMEQF